MGIFRRKHRNAEVEQRADAPAGPTDPAVTSADDGSTEVGVSDRAQAGPFDRSEVESSEGYVDLGSLWLPAVPGLALTMELDDSTGEVTAVRVHHEDSVLQLQVFAAPKSSGIWGEIRDELVTGITAQGGDVETPTGPLGAEVLARLAGAGSDPASGQVMRFFGVDGPRWFLRGVVSGSAADDPALAAPLVEFMRQVVVVRGVEPMGPRELLTLTLPPESVDESGPADAAPDAPPSSGPSTDDLNPFERGPEITETR